MPQASVGYVHEFKNDQRNIAVSFAQDTFNREFTFNNEEPDRDYFEAAVGLGAVFSHDWQGFVNLHSYIGNSNLDKYGADIGFRVTF